MTASDIMVSVVKNRPIEMRFLSSAPKMDFYTEGKSIFIQACKKTTKTGCPICVIIQQANEKN